MNLRRKKWKLDKEKKPAEDSTGLDTL